MNRIKTIEKHLFTGSGQIKLDLTDKEKNRWYEHLVLESEKPHKGRKISRLVKMQVMAGVDSGLSELEITRTVSVSRTAVRNFIINLNMPFEIFFLLMIWQY